MRIDRVKLAVELARREMRSKKLSELSGVSHATISAIKGGKAVSSYTVQKIAHALDVDATELLEAAK